MRLANLSLKVYLVLVFLSGVLVGAVGYGLYNARPVNAKSTADEVRRKYADEMRKRLKLTPDQTRKLGEILESTHERFQKLRERWHPEVKALQEDQVDRIRQMLTDSQKLEYEKMRQEREKKRQQSRLLQPRQCPGA